MTNKGEETRRFNLIIRQANEHRDWQSIVEFYFENPRPHLPTPTANDIYDACQNGCFYLVYKSTQQTTLLACAGALEWTRGTNSQDTNPLEDVQVYELTGALVKRLGALQPHTIHQLLVWLRTVGTAVQFGFGKSPLCFIAAVIEGNAESISTLERSRLELITSIPRWLAVDSRSWISGENANYYQVSYGAFQNHANALYDVVTNRITLTRRNKRDNVLEEYSLIFEIPWLIDSAALEAIVTGMEDGSVARIVGPPKLSRTKGGLL